MVVNQERRKLVHKLRTHARELGAQLVSDTASRTAVASMVQACLEANNLTEDTKATIEAPPSDKNFHIPDIPFPLGGWRPPCLSRIVGGWPGGEGGL